MLKTGKEVSEGQAFHRRLLSEYNTEITLDNYVSYFTLKPIAKKIERLRKAIEQRTAELPAKDQVSTFSEGTQPPHVSTRTVFVDPSSPVTKPSCRAVIEEDEKLCEMWKERRAAQRNFFEEFGKSFHKVKDYLLKLDQQMLAYMVQLHKQTDADIRDMDNDYIPFLYLKLKCIQKYRSLNLLAFRKILKKFIERCATDSLALQKRILEVDAVVAQSNIAVSSIDLRSIAIELITIYGAVYRYTYEEAVTQLQQYECRAGVNEQRIIPNSDTVYFANSFPQNERPGSFTIRVLAGSCSLFCEKMITEVLQCPRYPGNCCGHFANGETSVSLGAPLRGDDVFIVQSMVASERADVSNSDAIMELALMVHSAQLAAAGRITAVIPYLSYTRNTASISVVAEMIESMGCHHVITVDMSSEQVEGMFSIPMECISAKYEFVRFLTNQLRNEGNDFTNVTIVATSGDFLGRAKDFADALMNYGELHSEEQFVSVCTAVKRVRSNREKAGSRASIIGAAGGDSSPFTPTVSESSGTSPVGQHAVGAPHNTFPPVAHSSSISPTDMQVAELTHNLRVAEGSAGGAHGSLPRCGSTFGIEQALRKQGEGRRAVVTHRIEVRSEEDNFSLVGDVKGRLCVMLDTVIDEAVDICQVARSLRAAGAERIILVSTHAVFSGKALERLRTSPIDLIVVTDSVNQDDVMRDPLMASKLRVLPIAPLLARAIEKIHTENKLFSLYEKS